MSDQSSRRVDIVVSGLALDDADLVVVGVHGRDQTPAYLIDHVVDPIGDPSIAWVLPAAPGPRWWPASFMDERSANEPHLGAAVARLQVIAEHLAHVSAPVVWLGFSQGACLVAEVVARSGRPWGGLVVLSGGLVGPPGTELVVAGDLDAMPALVSCGTRDRWVPLVRVHETAAAFDAAGAAVTMSVFDDDEHAIRPAELQELAVFLDRVRRRGRRSV
ncbi:MAG: alpha/beta hydrolase [Acidimicrobiales bacterium]